MTLVEIAKECGTTASTVSRVLNGYTHQFSVNPELRGRIVDTAERVGYTPNPIFRAMRMKGSKPVTFLFRSLSMASTVATTNDAVEIMGDLLHANDYEYNYSFPQIIDFSQYRMPIWKTGALVIPDVANTNQLSLLEPKKAGALIVINGIGNDQCDVINSDEYENMKLVMQYLTQRGHRRIFYANYRKLHIEHYSITERLQSYRKLCGEMALTPLNGAELRLNDAAPLLESALEQRATAIIAYNHNVAQQIQYYAWKRGIRMPQDLSLICFNDNEQLNYMTPALTCLNPPGMEIGRQAGKILLNRLSCRDAMFENRQFLRLSGDIIERESVCTI